MTKITLGSKVVFKKDGNKYEGYVTYLDFDGYVVVYSPDNQRIEFETVKY